MYERWLSPALHLEPENIRGWEKNIDKSKQDHVQAIIRLSFSINDY